MKRYLLQGRFEKKILHLGDYKLEMTHKQLLNIRQAKGNIEETLQSMDRSKNALIIPETTNFPCFDFMLYLVEDVTEPTVVFIQTTISTADAHNKNNGDIEKLVDPMGVTIRALNSIFDDTCEGIILPKQQSESNQETKTVVFKKKNGKQLDNVFYVYASGVEEEKQNHATIPKNVIVLSKEYLEKNWKIIF